MQLTLEVQHGKAQPLQTQIFDQIRELILEGRLKPGTPVPATRALAEQLGVSRNTVTLAYEQLIIEGYLQTRKAVGTFVSFDLPESSLLSGRGETELHDNSERLINRRPVRFRGNSHPVVNRNRHNLSVDFWVGRPDPRSFPSKIWRRLLNRELSHPSSSLTEYGEPGGLPALRQAIAEHLGPARGISTTPEQVIIVAGCQEALNVAARLFVGQDTPVVVENPCYQGASNLMESYGAKLIPVPVDGEGLDVNQLPRESVSLAYVTPSHQYPMGTTLSLKRRLRLLDWAWETGVYIIEDDYDSDFRYDGSPLTALKGLDKRGSVIYMGTFSKSVGAGIRVGYLVVPRELVGPVTTVKALLDNGHPWLDQAVLAEFISSGSFNNHLRQIRHTYKLRRDCLIEAMEQHFGEVILSGVKGGMHVVWHLPQNFPKAIKLQEMALEAGIGIYSLQGGAASVFGRKKFGERAIMLGYSSTSEKQIREGIAQIAEIVPVKRKTRPSGADNLFVSSSKDPGPAILTKQQENISQKTQ